MPNRSRPQISDPGRILPWNIVARERPGRRRSRAHRHAGKEEAGAPAWWGIGSPQGQPGGVSTEQGNKQTTTRMAWVVLEIRPSAPTPTRKPRLVGSPCKPSKGGAEPHDCCGHRRPMPWCEKVVSGAIGRSGSKRYGLARQHRRHGGGSVRHRSPACQPPIGHAAPAAGPPPMRLRPDHAGWVSHIAQVPDARCRRAECRLRTEPDQRSPADTRCPIR